MQLKQGTTIANRYVVSEILGKGGMAIVYKARDIKLDRDVTLKIMREEFVKDDDFINRFNIEAKAAAKLTHQNIVNVYDVGKFGDIYFIVMEYIDGVTLKDIIKKRGAFSNEEVLGVAIQIAQALEVAHRNQIVHRDIKPQNILINSKGEVKVTDFGIARAINANTVTSGNNTVGSVHYFSPEQARGGYIDQKSDIYSLGITMFEMATGQMPFDDETVVAIALKHISEPLPKIEYMNENISPYIIDIIEKATQKVSLSRFDNIEEMNNELKRCLINLSRPHEYTDRVDEQTGDSYNEKPQDMNTFIASDLSHTLNISDEDITEIRTKAMTAFFDDGDIEEINRLSMNQEENYRKRKPRNNDYENYEENDDDDGSKKFVIGGIICAILLSGLIAFGVFNFISGSTELIDVPNFVGMTLDEAREEAKQYRITIDENSQRYDDDYEEGVIIEQDYVYGKDKIRIGGTVTVITSLGAEAQTVPDVVGDEADMAFKKLSDSGFDIEYVYDYYDGVEKNIVQKQMPVAGSEGASGDTVTIYVSIGEESTTTVVPSVLGKTKDQAQSILSQSDLGYGQTSYDYSNEYPEGTIFAQSPRAGQEIATQSSVDLFISKGPKPGEEPETESPEPSEEPTATPTPTEDTGNGGDTTPTTSQKTFTIQPIAGLQPTDKVSVRFVKISADGSASVVYENTVNASELPLNVTITGSGQERIQLSTKVNDGPYQIMADTSVNFGE